MNNQRFQSGCFINNEKKECFRVGFSPFKEAYEKLLNETVGGALVSSFIGEEIDSSDYNLICPGKRIVARGNDTGLLMLRFDRTFYSLIANQPIELTVVASTKKYLIPLDIDITDMPFNATNKLNDL